ncbi:MAG: glycoside hydrolase [Rhodanobacteraceae bacterium]|nr:MAG: glycoside hydrolase [Rhodanobacteraceae bacterium]
MTLDGADTLAGWLYVARRAAVPRRGRLSLMGCALSVAAVLLVCGKTATAGATPPAAANTGAAGYADVLDVHGTPQSPSDRRFNIFFDAGAWQGYSLPPIGDGATGFVGPFVASLHNGRWVDTRFAQFALTTSTRHTAIPLREVSGHAEPGYLQRTFAAPGLNVSQTLFFVNSRTALVRIDLMSSTARDVSFTVSGTAMPGLTSTFVDERSAVMQSFPRSASQVVTRVRAPNNASYRTQVSTDGYRITLRQPLKLRADQTATVYVAQTLLYDARTASPAAVDFATAWTDNRTRWNGYLKVASRAHRPGLPDATARHVAAKAMETLLGNWRAARGDLQHAGVVPAYSNPDFNECVWAWDSWKQAAALSLFAPRLAEDNLLEMFDYQAADGMIPDLVCLHAKDNNWRNTKPPLATWAALRVYRTNRDKAFLRALYPKLVRCHNWWFADRDHLHDGLAEYGSTDGTLKAAKWESGMDDDARFDHAAMLQNGKRAWSMNQDAVDLNAYLYRDATDLAAAASILGDRTQQAAWQQRAAALKAKIDTRFFDEARGYFFDVRIPDGTFVTTYGPAGWIPLWAGAATPAQAKAVARVLANPRKFDTLMPFPTLAADDPRFAPVEGYWRGPVWLDQAYFAVRGLERYGFDAQADGMALRLFTRAQGLTGDGPIRENYDPLTGQGLNSRNFSWSAASYLMLLLDPATGTAKVRQGVPTGSKQP